MHRFAFALLVLATASPAAAQTLPADSLEGVIARTVSPDSIEAYIRAMTARPTFPGSPFSREVAQATLDRLRSWGWEARIDTLRIPFPRPTERIVALGGPAPYTATLREPEIPGDPYTAQQDAHLETYFIYGPDGDVTAPVVYANFGLREDYAQLARMGIPVEGRIVLVRSGRMWRGGKVQLASEHGAVGVLVYSDPREQGYYDRAPYPQGPGRNEHGVERGSILNGTYPGDPLTPFEPSVEDTERRSFESGSTTLAAIPAQPLSAADALPLLEALQGEVVPESWRGALPVTYRTGPTRSELRLKVEYAWNTIEIYNVIGRLEGTVWPDEWVIRGNHHDGWVFGAQDPHSGHSAMLEEARALGRLYQTGWRPRRTVVYASWDAEEQGVIGSTEWVEANLEHLSRHAVAYLNTDVLGPGTLTASGSGAFAAFATELAGEILDPLSGVTLLDRARVASQVGVSGDFEPTGGSYDPQRRQIRMAPPGYGSDHHTFVSHAGIATLNFGFAGGFSLGAYHTSYDDFMWYSRFGDPGFRFGAAAAQLNATAVLRLSEAAVLPMRFTGTADAIAAEVEALKELCARLRTGVERSNRALDLDAFRILQLPGESRNAPDRAPVPVVDLTPLDRAVRAVREAADAHEARRGETPPPTDPDRIARINSAMMAVERAFLRTGGLPGRPHYRNELYSPGRLWDTVPLPAIGDAMLDGSWSRAGDEVANAARTLESIASAIVRVNRMLAEGS